MDHNDDIIDHNDNDYHDNLWTCAADRMEEVMILWHQLQSYDKDHKHDHTNENKDNTYLNINLEIINLLLKGYARCSRQINSTKLSDFHDHKNNYHHHHHHDKSSTTLPWLLPSSRRKSYAQRAQQLFEYYYSSNSSSNSSSSSSSSSSCPSLLPLSKPLCNGESIEIARKRRRRATTLLSFKFS
mmetsp:Transcript_13304/g.19041  ORF Transcript_13304/g.19041 Transcript_13304/m.19041 type:complete len:185 (-) Transcript_13304:262-816(-)